MSLTRLCMTRPCLHVQCPLRSLCHPLLTRHLALVPFSVLGALPPLFRLGGWASSAQRMADCSTHGVPAPLSLLVMPSRSLSCLSSPAPRPHSCSDSEFCWMVALGIRQTLPAFACLETGSQTQLSFPGRAPRAGNGHSSASHLCVLPPSASPLQLTGT